MSDIQIDSLGDPELARRRVYERIFGVVCQLATWSGVVVLAVLLVGTCLKAIGWLDWQFMTSFDSRFPEKAGILSPLWGSFWLIVCTAFMAIPLGVGAAIYLEEYSADTWLRRFIQVNIANLAGVPSIVYGILGLSVFVRFFGVLGPETKFLAIDLSPWENVNPATLRIPLPFGRTVISGAGTLALLVLPIVIVAAQEALRAIPSTLRHASMALGATRWQTIRHQVLPAALPGILTGVILAVSRAIGETAPLIMIGALTYVRFTPGKVDSIGEFFSPQVFNAPFDTFTALPIQIFNWVSRPKIEYEYVAAAAIIVLLVVLLTLNSIAIFARQYFRKKLRW